MDAATSGVIFAGVELPRIPPESPVVRLCALRVAGGMVVEVFPRFLARDRINRDARTVWRELARDSRRWCPDVTPYRPVNDQAAVRVRRWWQDNPRIALARELTLGRTGDGAWYLHETGWNGVGWRFPNFATALTECAARLIEGGWTKVAANFDDRGQQLPDEPLDGELG